MSAAPTSRRCAVEIEGRRGCQDGLLDCIFTAGHKIPHRFMAPDSTLRWWPVDAGDPPAWEDAIATPAADPRWPKVPGGDPVEVLRPTSRAESQTGLNGLGGSPTSPPGRASERPSGWPKRCGSCGAPWTEIGFDYADGFNCRACGGSDAGE